MKFRLHLSTPILGGMSLLLLLGQSHAILPFRGDDKADQQQVPDSSELANQEAEAQELFQQGIKLHDSGKMGKAEDAFKKIVHRYPLTRTAANSQFALARVYEADNDPHKAFDAYQKFLEGYPRSDQFGDAIRRQFELATLSMNSRTTQILGLVPAKAQPSRVIEMFEQVAANAPYSSYAPLSLYNIGLLEADSGHQEDAILAFQRLTDSYPDDPKAKEASLQIIEVRQGRTTRDDSQIERTQLEMEKFIYDYADDPRSDELREKVGKLEEREAEKKFNIGRYYERKGNLKAAAIYYQDVRRGTGRYEDAQGRLEELKAVDPNLVQSPRAPKRRVTASTSVTDRPDYYGPPPPKLKTPAKPKMRASAEDVLPIPVE